MITNYETTNVLNAQIMGLSTDTKPTTGVQPNSLFWELDTNGMYFFDGTQWRQIGGSGGGGGGDSDFSVANVIFYVDPAWENQTKIDMAIVVDEESMYISNEDLDNEKSFNFVLYKGNQFVFFRSEEPIAITNVEVSGNIEIIEEEGELVGLNVKGDGAMTISLE